MKPARTAAASKNAWERVVEEGAGCTIPQLDLDVQAFRAYREGETTVLPERCRESEDDRMVMAKVRGRDVLCLGAGGGQQSALFSLLGARVTVLDLCEGQLAGDRKAAAHYGYEITTIQGDMRDLSCLADESFDLVYGMGTCYIPDVREVYVGVARVLRAEGTYHIGFMNPATEFVDTWHWDGVGYRITMPYAERERRRPDGMAEFRHYLGEVFNGLLETGFSIEHVFESPGEVPGPELEPGSYAHWREFIGGGFSIVARKRMDAS
jgi:SAM-dependent methyltransferase